MRRWQPPSPQLSSQNPISPLAPLVTQPPPTPLPTPTPNPTPCSPPTPPHITRHPPPVTRVRSSLRLRDYSHAYALAHTAAAPLGFRLRGRRAALLQHSYAFQLD